MLIWFRLAMPVEIVYNIISLTPHHSALFRQNLSSISRASNIRFWAAVSIIHLDASCCPCQDVFFHGLWRLFSWLRKCIHGTSSICPLVVSCWINRKTILYTDIPIKVCRRESERGNLHYSRDLRIWRVSSEVLMHAASFLSDTVISTLCASDGAN